MPTGRLPLIALVSLLTAAAATAGVNSWTTNGPWGGPVTCLASVPNDHRTLFAGTFRGLFVSRDAGSTWIEVVAEEQVTSLAASEERPVIVYAATTSPSLLISLDGGVTWNERPTSPTVISALAVDHDGSVYVGTQGDGIWKSLDHGDTWFRANEGLADSNLSITALAASPSQDGLAYAGTVSGIYRTTSGGAHWTLVSNLVPKRLDIDVHGATYAVSGAAVFRSLDGQLWLPVEGGESLPTGLEALAIAPDGSTIWVSQAARVFAWTSSSGWIGEPVSADEFNYYIYDLAPPASESGRGLIGATSRGVIRRLPQGDWTDSNDGLLGRQASSVAADPGSADVYAAEAYSVFRSSELGHGWSESRMPGAVFFFNSSTAVVQVAVTRALSRVRVFAGTRCTHPRRCPATPGLWRSDDSGTHWTWTGLDGDVTGLVVHPHDPAIAYASLTQCIYFPYQQCSTHDVMSTVDGGENWVRINDRQISVKAIDPLDVATVYGVESGSLLKSVNGGATWIPTPLPEAVQFVVLSLGTPQTILAGGFGPSLFRSVDGAATWERLQDLSSGIRCLAADPINGDVFFAGTDGSGVYRSIDRGETWRPFSVGIERQTVYDLAFDPSGRILYAATDQGVFSRETRSPRLVAPR